MLYTILCCFTVQLNATTTYKVKIGTFAQKIPFTHFAFSGVNDIYLDTDKSNIHHYYLRATFLEYQKAKAVRDTLIIRGFQNAVVISLDSNTSPGLDANKLCKDNTIYFNFDDHRLNRKARFRLDSIATALSMDPNLRLAIIGYTDSKGDALYNIRLSKNRVRSVRRYLINNGVSSLQILAKACGEANPVCSNTCDKGLDLPENRKQNRRVMLLTLNQYGELIHQTSSILQNVHPVLERKVLKD